MDFGAVFQFLVENRHWIAALLPIAFVIWLVKFRG